MALYFFSISTMRGGPGGPIALSGIDGLSNRLSHSDMESSSRFLSSDFCNVLMSNVRKMSKVIISTLEFGKTEKQKSFNGYK